MTVLGRDGIAALFAELALEAGQAIMLARGAPARAKADGSPVTQADLDADRVIREGLARALPTWPVVTEEAAETHGATALPRFILVDPLDGTREFVAGRSEFTVNIGLIENGVPIAGAVYAPALNRLYLGGESAWRADVERGAALPAFETMQPLAAQDVPAGAWRAVASRSHLDPQTRAWLDGQPIGGFYAAGSSLKFCVIAEGQADVYPRLSPTMEWDTAAGHAILLAAGGRVECADGTDLHYGKPGYRNPHFVAWGRREQHNKPQEER